MGCFALGCVRVIFVVDDDPEQAQLLAAALDAQDRRVRAFSDPLRALAALHSERSDLLIADLSMPWLDGMQMAGKARDLQPHIGLVLVSGYPRGREAAQLIGLPFFPKPIDLVGLRATVDDLLAHLPPGAEAATPHHRTV